MPIITFFYNLLWGDLISIPLPNGGTIGLSLLVLILIPAGIFFTVRTRFLPIRLFPECFASRWKNAIILPKTLYPVCRH